jgi:hypothetical protein
MSREKVSTEIFRFSGLRQDWDKFEARLKFNINKNVGEDGVKFLNRKPKPVKAGAPAAEQAYYRDELEKWNSLYGATDLSQIKQPKTNRRCCRRKRSFRSFTERIHLVCEKK